MAGTDFFAHFIMNKKRTGINLENKVEQFLMLFYIHILQSTVQ